MLKLCKAPTFPGWNVPSLVPACVKLETWFRMAKVPYELMPFPPMIPPPKGKFPFIDEDGVLLGDSTLIIEHMKRTRGVDPDERLSSAERSIGTAFRRMVKENMYWGIVHARWREESAYEVQKALWIPIYQEYLPKIGVPSEQAESFLDTSRKGFLDQLHGHGIGRHSPDEIYRLCTEDLQAISDSLGDKPFFFGDEPVGVDATLYGYVTNVVDVPLDDELTRAGRARKNLVDYCGRMRARFYADLADA